MAENETERGATLPKTIEEVQAITHVPTTEATRSFANFINKYLTNADNFTGITEEQAWTVIGVHRVWQQSDERKQEKEANKAAAEEAAKAREAEREQRKEQRAKEKAEKDAEKARKKAEREAAKEAAKNDSADDLDSVDAEGDGEIPAPAKKSRRRRPPAKPDPIEELDGSVDDVVEEEAVL